MEELQGLLVKQLVLCGYRKDYVVPFKEGVNIIHGDADTGKSSILRFIHYLLGGSSIKLDEEVTSSVKYAVLEVLINNNVYCISRDIYNPSRDVEVYSCAYSEIKNNYPEKYKSSVSKSDAINKSLSDFIIESLGYPAVRIRQSPTKDSSDTAKLSFLDLFKYMYLDQDDVGSTHMLNLGNYFLETKNREVFKYIFNVLDSNISELEVDISNKSKEKNDLNNKFLAVAEFFSQTEFKSLEDINDELDGIDDLSIEFENSLTTVNTKMISDNSFYNGIKGALDSINLKIEEYLDIKSKSILNIEKFTRLSNDYQNDLDCLNASLSAIQIIGVDEVSQGVCPICNTIIGVDNLKEKFEINNEDKINSEITSINRRLRDLKVILHENKDVLRASEETLIELYSEKNKAKELLDDEMQKSISPYLVERDIIVGELAQLKERKEKASSLLKIRNKHDETGERISRLNISIENLKIKLEKMKSNTPSVEKIVQDLSVDLDRFIKKIKIYNHHGIEVDYKTFMPKVRGIEYKNINSGGLRTIISIGYLASILEQKLYKDTNLPGLLMIDTVGKFLGKTSILSVLNESEEDIREGVADPEKYKNLFNTLVDLADKFNKSKVLCQMILVDNDIPPDIKLEHKDIGIISFSSSGMNGLPIGLIDDLVNE